MSFGCIGRNLKCVVWLYNVAHTLFHSKHYRVKMAVKHICYIKGFLFGQLTENNKKNCIHRKKVLF